MRGEGFRLDMNSRNSRQITQAADQNGLAPWTNLRGWRRCRWLPVKIEHRQATLTSVARSTTLGNFHRCCRRVK
jgi:hypothetical protein